MFFCGKMAIGKLMTLNHLNKLIIGIFLSLGLFACGDGGIIASVDSEKITGREFEKYSKRKATLLGRETLTAEDKRAVLDDLIQREVTYLQARKRGVTVSEGEVKETMKDFPFFDRIRHKKGVKKGLIIQKMQNRVSGGWKVSEGDIKAYYESKRDDFIAPEMYRVYLVQVDDSRQLHVLERAREDSEAFDDMALRTSSEELRKINENAPFTKKEDFPEEMWPYLEKMEVGDIEGPIEVKRGTFLFKVVDKQPSYTKSLPEAHIEIEHLIASERRKERLDQWYESVKAEHRIEIKLK
jgi:hypothetical protein